MLIVMIFIRVRFFPRHADSEALCVFIIFDGKEGDVSWLGDREVVRHGLGSGGLSRRVG